MLGEFWAKIIPQPVDGRYSRFKPRDEKYLVESVVDEVKDAEAQKGDIQPGHLLFLIRQSSGRSSVPNWPEELSTRADCDTFIEENPQYVYILKAVREKEAYAWFCEYSEFGLSAAGFR